MNNLILLASNLIIFIVLFVFSFYPAGYLVLNKRTKILKAQETIALSFGISIVLFVLLAVALAILKIRPLMIYLIAGANLFSIIKYRSKLLIPWKKLGENKLLILLIILGILVQGFINFPNGYLYKEGLLFWSSQGFDGFWHISLMEAVRRGIPPQIPIFSGEYLQNYHYLVDIFMGEFYRVFSFFNPMDLYFRFYPIPFSFFMGISIYSFMNHWKNKKIALWSLFFTYFVGSFGYVLTFIKQGKLFGGETAFWVSQLNTIIANPPHAVAISLLVIFLLSLLLYAESESKNWIMILLLLGLCISGFKVSGGAVLLTGLGAMAFVRILTRKKFDYLLIFLTLLVTNYLTIKLVSKNAESYLIFQPWWFIRTMVVVKLDLVDWELRRQIYLAVGRFTSYLRIIQLEGTALLIFIVGNLGTRIIGFSVILDQLRHIKRTVLDEPINILLIVIGLTGFVVPMLFLQKGIVYNSIQFMQYTLLIMGFYGAIAVFNLLKMFKTKILKIMVGVLLVILSVPTVIGNFVEFYGGHANAVVSPNEINAMEYLKSNSKVGNIILPPTFNSDLKYKYKTSPLPIYAWFGTAYVSSLTDRNTYLACEEMLQQTGYSIDNRIKEINNFFAQTDFNFNKEFLKQANISFVYAPKAQVASLDETKNGLTKVYSNDEIEIYKVN